MVLDCDWSIASWLLFLAGDPFPDVRWTVAKRDAVPLARSEESDNVSIDEDYVPEIQHENAPRRLRGEQRGQFAHVADLEPATQREHDLAICVALDFQHRSVTVDDWCNRPANSRC